jgi:hypothetical protein
MESWSKNRRIKLLTVCGAMVFPWLLAAPFLFPEGPAARLVAVLVGGLGILAATLAMLVRWLRPAVAWLGLLAALSSFFLAGSVAATACQLLAGLVLIIAGWMPGILRFQLPAGAIDSSRLVDEPLAPRPDGPALPAPPPEPAPA